MVIIMEDKKKEKLEEIISYEEKCCFIEKKKGFHFMNIFIEYRCKEYLKNHPRAYSNANEYMNEQLDYVKQEVGKLYTRVKNGERN